MGMGALTWFQPVVDLSRQKCVVVCGGQVLEDPGIRGFRRQPVFQPGPSQPAGATWRGGQLEPQRQLLGQRGDGAIFPEPKNGAGLAAQLCQSNRGHCRYQPVHRWFLQPVAKLQQSE